MNWAQINFVGVGERGAYLPSHTFFLKGNTMLRLTLLFALFAVLFTGCGDTHYYTEPVADPIADTIFAPTPQPDHTIKHVVDHVVPPTEYNPFKNSLENVELTLDEFRDDLLLIVTMPGGPEIINVLGLNISVERKATVIFNLPASKAKTMLLQASVDHIDTIETLTDLFAAFTNKNGNVVGTVIKAIKG